MSNKVLLVDVVPKRGRGLGVLAAAIASIAGFGRCPLIIDPVRRPRIADPEYNTGRPVPVPADLLSCDRKIEANRSKLGLERLEKAQAKRVRQLNARHAQRLASKK